MNNVICFVVVIGCVGSLPLELDMTAGLRNGNSIIEGDLVEGDIIALGHSSVKNLVRQPSQLWPGKIFPYKFSADFNKVQKLNVESALTDLASQTCVQFRERTDESTYIVFKNYGKTCASVVGFVDLRNLGGEMPIYVSFPACKMRGQIQHEVLHSLGFWHEHTRPDRNEYVTVNWDNIEPGSESNFEARTWADTQTLDLPYDINSVMHYSDTAFSRDGSSTLTAKLLRKDANMGQRFRYMGSFAVGSPEVAGRAEYVRSRLEGLRHSHRSTPVLLIISLAGIKVCSPDGKIVQMAHALRRISYATCEPRHAQFSFLAREPGAHFSLQYCHSFITETPEQAEELNTIVGNAFRMAYAAQLQRQPILQEVISPQPTPSRRKDRPERTINSNKQSARGGDSTDKSTIFWPHSVLAPTPRGGGVPPSTAEMNVQLGSAGSPTLRLSTVKTPNSIPGLRPSHNFNNVLGPITNDDGPKSLSQQSTPSSDESNSPTELNSYKRLTDKPPLIKRLTMGLAGGRDVLSINGEDDSCPLVSGGSTPTSPTNRPRSGGYVNEAIIDSEGTRTSYNKITCASENLDNNINSSINAKNFNAENNRISHNSPNSVVETEFKSKRRSQISTSGSSVPPDGSTHGSTPTQTPTPTPTPPPLPERTDSLNNRTEESELRKAPWFQAGIPREITLEVLSQEPEGAFMVRESTSKPGCYALSLRVPREFQPSGIAHYLIMRTNKGYKIKGFTKEFTTLTALITHHSVMPELLPCPLSLSRYNPSFVKSDSNKDFADIDSDPDYNTLADFRKMMADLNV